MRLEIQTIVLNGEPYIEWHLPIFKNLKHDWHWTIVHGTAMNGGSTSWCAPQKPGCSTDGTTEYLWKIRNEPNVSIINQSSWESKDEMCNVGLFDIKEPCVLMEIDSDEIWSSEQLDTIMACFGCDPIISLMKFACDYYVGPNLILKGEHCYGDNDYEWMRAWKFRPGMTFKSHEPPILNGLDPTYFMDKDETRRLGLVFSHYAYATEAQVAYKEKFYRYPGLTKCWRAMQTVQDFPFPLSDFFWHVKGELPLVVKV